MANPERGEVELVVGDKTYTLRMAVNAVAEVENLMFGDDPNKGINDLVAMIRNPKGFRVGTWRTLLWGALREFHKVSLEEAGEIMGAAGVDLIVEKVGAAMAASFPEGEKASGENPQ